MKDEELLPPPSSVTNVEPAEALAGTLLAGVLAFFAGVLASTLDPHVRAFGDAIQTGALTGLCALCGAGGMALWHHSKG